MPRKAGKLRRICFVTGTRAEFGLMRTALNAIDAHASLELQLVVTGMHFDRRRGRSLDQINAEGWLERHAHALVPWRPMGEEPATVAAATGRAVTGIAKAISNLKSQVLLVVGDRVEAFAGAAAGHIAGAIVAHIHGGDRALGQVDDSLRHAITKLSHVHFPATLESAKRIERLGEERRRIHRVGSPGVDGIAAAAAPAAAVRQRLPLVEPRRFALVVLHPTDADPDVEAGRAKMILRAVRGSGVDRAVIVYPNNDPGSAGIIRCWEAEADAARESVLRDVPRGLFLALLRDAAMLVGNSSSGIIEAASFGTAVIDVGPRQLGRERSENVTNVPFAPAALSRALRRVWNDGRPVRYPRKNVYGGDGAGRRMADALAKLVIDDDWRRKLITY